MHQIAFFILKKEDDESANEKIICYNNVIAKCTRSEMNILMVVYQEKKKQHFPCDFN